MEFKAGDKVRFAKNFGKDFPQGNVVALDGNTCPWGGCCWNIGGLYVPKTWLSMHGEPVPETSPSTFTAKHIGVALAMVAGLSIAEHRRKHKAKHDCLETAELRK